MRTSFSTTESMSPEESAQKIFAYLSEALSDNAQTRGHGEKCLREAEEKIDYFSSLVIITAASDEDADPRIRWLAAVCGKNSILRSWRRRTCPNQVTEDERIYVKETLLSTLQEKHSIIASQTALWIANIARIDYPKYWPSLLSNLCQAVVSNNIIVMKNATDTIDMVLKQLASRRLLSDRQALYIVAPKIFQALYNNFCVHTKTFTENNATDNDRKLSFQVVARCLKSFRRLVAYGCSTLQDLPLLNQVFSTFASIPMLYLQSSGSNDDVPVRLSYLATKLVRVTHEKHPIEFQPYLEKFLEIYYLLLINFDTSVSNDRICYQAAFFIRNCVQCVKYDINSRTIAEFEKGSSSLPNGSDHLDPSTACRHIVLNFLNRSRVDQLVQAIIQRVFVFSQVEQENWIEDPETLVREEEAAADWGTQNLRHECEELFKILLIRDKRHVVPFVLQLAQSVPVDKPFLLDACYRAVGRAVYDIQGAFDFDVWLQGQLKGILEADCSPNLGERIIQARTAWLVGQFCEQLTRDNRIIVNPLLVRLMTFGDKDRVIALTAAKAVQTLVEDLGFNPVDFAPHFALCLRSAFQLISTSESIPMKRDIVTMVVSLIDRMSPEHVSHAIEMIADAIPQIWQSSTHVNGTDTTGTNARNSGTGTLTNDDGRSLLQATIASLLSNILDKIGPVALQSAKMSEVICSVLQFSVDRTKGMGGLFMMEDGCTLWLSLLSASTEYTDKLREFVPLTKSILGDDFDNLKQIFDILESYMLLGGYEFMREYASSIISILMQTMQSTNNRGCMAALGVLDKILLKFPVEGVTFTAELLRLLLGKVVSRVEGQVMTTAFISVLARAIVSNSSDFVTKVLKSEETYGQFMETALQSFSSMYRFNSKKLTIASLCSLASINDKNMITYRMLPNLMRVMVRMMKEESNANPKPVRKNSDAFQQAIASPGFPQEAEEVILPGTKRLEALMEQDIVKHVDLKIICRDLLVQLQRNGEWYQAAVQATDQVVLQETEKLVIT